MFIEIAILEPFPKVTEKHLERNPIISRIVVSALQLYLAVSHISILATFSVIWTLMSGWVDLCDAKKLKLKI